MKNAVLLITIIKIVNVKSQTTMKLIIKILILFFLQQGT